MARRRHTKRSHSLRTGGLSTHGETVSIFKGRGSGRVRGRYCVKVKMDAAPTAKHARQGAKLKPVRFYGCFVHKRDAEARVARLEKVIG